MQVPNPAPPDARALARRLGMTITMADVLLRQGLGGDEAGVRRFLNPRLSDLTPPSAMADRQLAADRIVRALRHEEPIVVYGDYDCDGMTSTAILTEGLRAMGGRVDPVLASRFDGGYGLSEQGLKRALAGRPSLLITCDCGSADHERVASAKASGVDVIVIDHHLVPAEPLPALAFLNPHRPECGFPYKGLASCGLALSVLAAVRAEQKTSLDLRTYLDLVAVGTIADVAPLDGDNRALVRAGLGIIASGARPGLRALAEYGRLELGTTPNAEDVSFKLAPRLNAPGRLGSPDDALSVLLARDLVAARSAAAACEQANLKRKEIQDRMVAEAVAEVEREGYAKQAAMVLASDTWHLGVVGIVAGRLASTYGRPVVVAAIHEGVAHGSVRSAGGVPVVTALGRCREALLGLGGHEKAAGVKFIPARLGEVREAFAAAVAALEAGAQADPQPPTVRLDPSDEPSAIVRDFALLEPCGERNRAPSVCAVGALVVSAREVRGGHLSLDLEVEGRRMRGFGAQLGGRAGAIGRRVNVWGGLRRDGWKGGDAVEIRVDEVSPA
ncbi:MAG: single-stranded-DNA-specific exonuclease RecJ [Polyangiaceae bacterium]|nr:single-stranded-DNA-specific exonuclease RecJ [Polyangiaceae bacterium]